MSEPRDDGGSAFPLLRAWDRDQREYADCFTAEGMSLRDYFAGQALCGVVGSSQFEPKTSDETLARVCYKWADAMLAARKA